MAADQTAGERLLTIPEVAERSGFRETPSTERSGATASRRSDSEDRRRSSVYLTTNSTAGLPASTYAKGRPRDDPRRVQGVRASCDRTAAEFAAKHGDHLNAARTREARRRETVTHLPKIADELIRKKRRLEHVVRRHHWRQGPAFSVPLEAQSSDGRRVSCQYWPHSGRAEILEPAS